jgi:hypothetical protein
MRNTLYNVVSSVLRDVMLFGCPIKSELAGLLITVLSNRKAIAPTQTFRNRTILRTRLALDKDISHLVGDSRIADSAPPGRMSGQSLDWMDAIWTS